MVLYYWQYKFCSLLAYFDSDSRTRCLVLSSCEYIPFPGCFWIHSLGPQKNSQMHVFYTDVVRGMKEKGNNNDSFPFLLVPFCHPILTKPLSQFAPSRGLPSMGQAVLFSASDVDGDVLHAQTKVSYLKKTVKSGNWKHTHTHTYIFICIFQYLFHNTYFIFICIFRPASQCNSQGWPRREIHSWGLLCGWQESTCWHNDLLPPRSYSSGSYRWDSMLDTLIMGGGHLKSVAQHAVPSACFAFVPTVAWRTWCTRTCRSSGV